MLHHVNSNIGFLQSIREWVVAEEAPVNYQMVIHADRNPEDAHVGPYNGPSSSEIAAIIPGSEDGMIWRRDILLSRRGTLNSNGKEVIDKLRVTHRSYDPLSYILLFHDGMDG